jgi:hypothetical protein
MQKIARGGAAVAWFKGVIDMPRSRLLVVPFVLFLLVFTAAQVLAYAFSAGSPVRASGPSPFAACTVGAFDSNSKNYPGAEVEPFVAVNPTNAQNIIGVYQQDRWSDGGAHGLVTASSNDGGVSWANSFVKFSNCADPTNPYLRASDPWVTFDTAGNAYQISISFSPDETHSAVMVAKSTNGGSTWTDPTALIQDTLGFHFNDKESITGDPTRPGYVYAVWDRGTFPSDMRAFRSFLGSHAFRGQPMFSRTIDGGAHWSIPVGLANQNIFTIGNQIGVLPDGTLVDVFQKFQGSGNQPSPNPLTESVMLSRDAGVTWSQPIDIGLWTPESVHDPDNGNPLRTGNGLPDLAVDPNSGTIYAVWEDGAFSADHHADIAFSRSTDGGHKWSAPIKVNQSPSGVQAFTPSVAVSADGTVGVMYYDLRRNDSNPGLPTDAWFVHSHDGGATWTEQHVAGSFDVEKAPISRGYFLGDYEGLATVANDFLALVVMTDNTSTGPTDVFSVRLSK